MRKSRRLYISLKSLSQFLESRLYVTILRNKVVVSPRLPQPEARSGVSEEECDEAASQGLDVSKALESCDVAWT